MDEAENKIFKQEVKIIERKMKINKREINQQVKRSSTPSPPEKERQN